MSTSPSSALQEGARLYQAGDAAGARPHLEQAVRENPSSGPAQQYLGIVRCQLGDFAGGVAALREAVRLQPADASARYYLGVALERTGDTPGARTALEEALVLEPGNARARTALGRLPGGGSPAAAAAAPTGMSAITAPAAAAPPPPPPAAAAPAGLAPIGGGGLAPIGGGGGLAPIGGGPSAPPAAGLDRAVGTNAPSGLSSVGGPAAAAAPAGLPVPPPPPSMYPPPPPPMGAAGARPVPDINQMTSGSAIPSAALHTNAFSREPTSGERMSRGVGWGSLLAQVLVLVNAVFLFLFGVLGQRPGQVGIAMVGFLVIILISSLVFAIGGAILGAVIAALGADEDQGATIGGIFGIGFLILRAVALLGISGFSFFGILLGVPFWWWTGSWLGKMIAEKVNERVGVS